MVLFEVDLEKTYPIGAIFLSINDTNPSEHFGGVWERIKDKFLLASGDVYANGTTGGSADAVVVKHNHTQNSHNHTQNSHNHTQNSHNHTQNAHNHALTGSKSVGLQEGSRLRVGYGSTSDSKNTNNATATNKATTATNQATTATNQATTATNKETGVDGTGKNMPPYLAVYVWVRVG
ncbi:phage baseplate protein [Methanobrevibacter ruminantium]|uniref:phage baseplate protein n=1 Tax=Methanobrevibacter ruminantium TaxID=83816 RepID=UPI0025FC25D8|nr:hypothetical protein [uncultured Methanobrevibacter sp.]